MRSRPLRALVVCAAFAVAAGYHAHVAAQSSAPVVISEFRTRGPNGGNDGFIELHTIFLSCTDPSGNIATETRTVFVPR